MKYSKLHAAIDAAGLKQTELAAQCGVSLSTVSVWLSRSASGRGRLPVGEAGKEIELVLGVRDFRALFPYDWPEVGE